MNAAHERAETLRRQGGTLRADQDTASTLALKTAIQSNGVHLTISSPTVEQLNQGIVQAKVQYSYAQARGDQSAMAAAHALAENYRAMGGTISASASLVDAQRQAASLSSNTNYSSTAGVTQATVQARIDYATAHAMVGTPGDNATVAQARANWTNTVSKPQLEKLSNEIDNSDGSDTVTVFYHPQDGSSVIDNGKNATVVIPPSQPDADLQNSLVEDDKLAYINASVRGDQQVMQQKSNDANYHRDLGATLASGDDTAATQDLKNYYSNDPYVLAALKSHSKDDLNKAIWKAKNDFAYAQKTHDEAGMKAAAAMAENMRMMGGTIGSDVTLEDAKDMAFGSNQVHTNSTQNQPSIAQMKEDDETYKVSDHDQLLAGLKAYYMAKLPDYLPDQVKEEAVQQDMKMLDGYTTEQLYDRLHDLVTNDEQAAYYAKKVQQNGFDSKTQWHADAGYQGFVKVQLAQNEGPGGTLAAGMMFAAGIMNALSSKFGKGAGETSGANETDNQNSEQVDNNKQDGAGSNSNNVKSSGETVSVSYGDQYTKIDGKKALKSNVEYTDPNGYTYKTDNLGRITDTEATLQSGTGTRNKYSQVQVGQPDRSPTDQGGHLIATIFNGSGDIDNLVSMDGNLNQGAYKSLESTWQKALDSGKTVKVNIAVNYEGGSKRPSSFDITYSINGEKRTVEFKNTPGGK